MFLALVIASWPGVAEPFAASAVAAGTAMRLTPSSKSLNMSSAIATGASPSQRLGCLSLCWGYFYANSAKWTPKICWKKIHKFLTEPFRGIFSYLQFPGHLPGFPVPGSQPRIPWHCHRRCTWHAGVFWANSGVRSKEYVGGLQWVLTRSGAWQ